jgi:hypothetical protein
LRGDEREVGLWVSPFWGLFWVNWGIIRDRFMGYILGSVTAKCVENGHSKLETTMTIKKINHLY